MARSRGFMRREGARRRIRGRREMTMAAIAMQRRDRERRGRGTHPCRTPLTMTIYTVPLPPDRVLLILNPKTIIRTTMTKRGAWWEYLSSGYVQLDTWRP